MSFPAGSAGGPDRLLPRDLKDLTFPSLWDTGVCLIESLASFVTLVISGKVPREAAPFFFGASLLGLDKADCTPCWLAAKCLGNQVSEEMGTLLSPIQLGFDISLRVEGAINAARAYLTYLQPGFLMVKFDCF